MSPATERLSAALADRYRIERELGQGGMATVYLALDLKHDRQVAIKVLRPELAAVIGAERFLREIKTIASLQHPHILGLIDSGEVDGTAYYVMPFVEGESLRDRLVREKQLPIADAIRLSSEIAGALDYAHRHGVIHRDIKPENILLHDGSALVADFGIALAASNAGGSRMTETGMSLGTPHYMSPEQAMGEREITARSDVYALGAVTYEMLVGDPPFTGSSAQAIVAKVVTEKPPAIRRVRDRVPEQVEDAVLTALEKLPADRFGSAAAFAEALTGPPRLRGGATMGGGPPWLADRRSWLAIAVAVVSLGTALFLLARPPAGDTALAEMSVSQNTFASEAIFAARWAPDGQTMVFSAARTGFMPRLYVIRPDYPQAQPFGPDSLHLLAISSAGELAVLTRPVFGHHRVFLGTLARMPIGGGAPREVLEGVQEADWSPDGTELAITRPTPEGNVLEYPIGRTLYQGPRGGYLSDPRVSPSGDRIAFFQHNIEGDDRGVVMVVDTSGTASTITSAFWGLEGLAWEAGGKTVIFSGAKDGGSFQLHRAGIGVEARLVLPTPGTLTMHDLNQSGDWLVTRDDTPFRVFVRPPGAARVQDFSWLDFSLTPVVSVDGKMVAFGDQSQQAGALYGVMLRKTDGSPAIRLGEGTPRAFSPDMRWVVGEVPTVPTEWRLYPTGAGETQPLQWPGLEAVNSVVFFPDGNALLVCGREPGKAARCYRSAVDASMIEPVTPDSVGDGILRPDGLALAQRRLDGVWIYPLSGGEPAVVPGLRDGEIRRWSPDGRALWVETQVGDGLEVDAVAVATGRRTPLLRVQAPPDVPGFQVFAVSLADNPQVYAYWTWTYASQIFTIRGVR